MRLSRLSVALGVFGMSRFASAGDIFVVVRYCIHVGFEQFPLKLGTDSLSSVVDTE